MIDFDRHNDLQLFSSELKALRAINDLSLQNPIELEPGKIIEYDIFYFSKQLNLNL